MKLFTLIMLAGFTLKYITKHFFDIFTVQRLNKILINPTSTKVRKEVNPAGRFKLHETRIDFNFKNHGK